LALLGIGETIDVEGGETAVNDPAFSRQAVSSCGHAADAHHELPTSSSDPKPTRSSHTWSSSGGRIVFRLNPMDAQVPDGHAHKVSPMYRGDFTASRPECDGIQDLLTRPKRSGRYSG
jgi:hypothetical protein